MAFQISPGVNFSEIDLTTIVPAVGTTAGAFVGPFQWGPLNEIVQVDSEITLANEFGKPNADVFTQWFTAKNFLDYANNLNVVRVAGANAKNSTSDGSGVLISNQTDYDTNFASGTAAKGNWAGKYPGILGNGIIVSMADAGNYGTWAYKRFFTSVPGTSNYVSLKGGSNDELHVIVIDGSGLWTGTPGSVLETFPFVSKASDATNDDGTSNYYANVVNRQSSYIWWLDLPVTTPLDNWGVASIVGGSPTVFDVLDTVVVFSSLISGTDYTVGETVSVFSVPVSSLVLGGSGNVGYETVPTLTIDAPEAPGVRATGHAVLSSTGTVKHITINNPGSGYTDNSYTVNISGTPGTATATVVVSGGMVSSAVVLSAGSGFTGSSTTSNSAFDESGLGAGTDLDLSYTIGYTVASVVLDTPGSGYESAPHVGVSGGTPTTPAVVTATVSLTGTPVKSATVLSWNSGSKTLRVAPSLGSAFDHTDDDIIGATSTTSGIATSVTSIVDTDNLNGAVDANALGTGATHTTDGELFNGYDLFANADTIDISLILTANYSQDVVEHAIQNIAEERLDCVAFLSPQFSDVVNNAGFEAASVVATRNTYASSSYAFMDANWMYMYDKYNDVFRWVPCNGGVAGLAVATDQTKDPWWSFAGLNRGILKNVVKLAWNPSRSFRDTLYAAGVNPIVSFPGEGPVLFGDKTMLSKPSAFDRINVRRLFIVLEKSISTAAKFQLFEFNDAFTQAQFVSMVEPFLRDVEGRRGITDFKVVCDSTNNTPQVVDSNQFVGDIYIKPARSINFIQLNFVAVATGVDFTEVVGKF